MLLRRNFNQKSSATIDALITVDATTTTVAKVANTDRRYLSISVQTNDVFIKLQAASVDNALKGISVGDGETWEMSTDAIYTGEVSAIRDGGGQDADIFVTEY